jgi:hypothetical protein
MNAACGQLSLSAAQVSGRVFLSRSRPYSVTSSVSRTMIIHRVFSSTRGSVRKLSSKGPKRNSTKRPRLKTASDGVEGVWYTTSGPRSTSLEMGRYGLRRLDYATLEPRVWTLPPKPPTKSLADKIIFPLTLVTVAGVAIWAYMNPEEEDMREYWKRVETGQILLEDDDDDDDDDDDWDDGDEDE